MNHMRHLDLYNFFPGFSATLIGAGGIGAITALTLAKMGIPVLNIFDDDVVDETNLPGQLHKLSDIGEFKVHSLYKTLYEFADDTDVRCHVLRVDGETVLPKSNVIISAVDSIAARKQIWQTITSQHDLAYTASNATYYIDARMGAENYQHFAIELTNDDDVINYDTLLHSVEDGDIPDLPCTAKATIFTGMMSAGHIATVVRNILRDQFKPHRLVHYIPEETIFKFNI